MKFSRVLMLGGLLAAMVAFQGRAADPTAEDIDKAEKRATAVADVALASELASFAREVKSPESLVLAAGMLIRANGAFAGKAEALDAKPTDAKGAPVAGAAVKSIPLDKQADDLIAEAQAMVLDTKDKSRAAALEALIKNAKAFPTRGSVGGPRVITRTLAGGETHTYKIGFVSGQPAAVTMTSTGPAKIQFDIAHVTGNNLFSLKGVTANYTWTPGKDKDAQRFFNVTLTNVGKKESTYTVTTN